MYSHKYQYSVSQSAKKKAPALYLFQIQLILHFLKNAAVNRQQSAELRQAVSVNTWSCFYPPCPKSLLAADWIENIVECLILYTCGDYVPFDIRYALVKWVLTAFSSQSRIQVHMCTHTFTSPCWRFAVLMVIALKKTSRLKVCLLIVVPRRVSFTWNDPDSIFFFFARLRLSVMLCAIMMQYHANRGD